MITQTEIISGEKTTLGDAELYVAEGGALIITLTIKGVPYVARIDSETTKGIALQIVDAHSAHKDDMRHMAAILSGRGR